MTWVRLDDTLDQDPRVLEISLAAAGLLTMGMVWSCRYLTDGWISDAYVRQRAARDKPRLVEELTKARLWTRAERDGQSGYLVAPDLVELQPTRAEVEQKRAAWRERQRRSRTPNLTASVTRDSSVTHNDVTPSVTGASISPDPDPDPVYEKQERETSADSPPFDDREAQIRRNRRLRSRETDDGPPGVLGSSGRPPVKVITALARKDVLPRYSDEDDGEQRERIKAGSATANLRYDGASVSQALDIAYAQDRKLGWVKTHT